MTLMELALALVATPVIAVLVYGTVLFNRESGATRAATPFDRRRRDTRRAAVRPTVPSAPAGRRHAVAA